MDTATVVNLISSIAVIAGLVFAAVELRQYRTAREQAVALELLRSMQTLEFIKGLRMVYALPEGLGKAELDELLGAETDILYALMTTWESLGILVCRRHVRLELVDDFFSGSIVISWRKLEHYVMEEREGQGRATLLEWFQWLAERIVERESVRQPRPAYEAERHWKPA